MNQGTSPLSLVTGATGFMGSHMVELLVQSGHRVRATDLPTLSDEDQPRLGRYPKLLKNLKVDYRPADLTHSENLNELVEGVDFVFHIAGLFSYSAPRETLFRVNVEGTRRLLEALKKEGGVQRIVLWGAGGIHGSPRAEELPIRESSPKRPPNAYLESKWKQELLSQEFYERDNIPYCVIRPTGVYGPRAVYGVGQLICQLAGMKKIRLPKNLRGRNPLVHAEDVCRSALHLSSKKESLGEAYNLADDRPFTNIDLFRTLAQLLDRPFSTLPAIPIPLMKGGARFAATVENFLSKYLLKRKAKIEKDTIFFIGGDFWYSNEKLKGTGFDFKYPDAEKSGLKETIAWYKENRFF